MYSAILTSLSHLILWQRDPTNAGILYLSVKSAEVKQLQIIIVVNYHLAEKLIIPDGPKLRIDFTGSTGESRSPGNKFCFFSRTVTLLRIGARLLRGRRSRRLTGRFSFRRLILRCSACGQLIAEAQEVVCGAAKELGQGDGGLDTLRIQLGAGPQILLLVKLTRGPPAEIRHPNRLPVVPPCKLAVIRKAGGVNGPEEPLGPGLGRSLVALGRLSGSGIGLGFMTTRYEEYQPLDGHYVYRQTSRFNYFGPLKLKFALVWNIGRTAERKGGDR